RVNLNGQAMLTLAPEDTLPVIAIHGGQELWWNIKWACDAAAFIGRHPKLDWTATLERASTQGCRRLLLVAASLARKCFDALVPETMIAAERADPNVEEIVGRIVANWQADKPTGPPARKALRLDQLRLHDGALRRARHMTRSLFLPSPHQVAALP